LLLLSAGSEIAWSQEWPQFRGAGGKAQAEAPSVPSEFGVKDYLWQRPLPGTGHSSPVLWGNRLFLEAVTGETERKLICFDAANGNVLWDRAFSFVPYSKHRFNEFASATPCVDAQRLYVTWTNGTDQEALALTHEGQIAWQRQLGPFQGDHGSGSSPVLVDGVLFVFWDHLANRTTTYAGLDPATGNDLWRRVSNWPAAGELKTTYSTPAIYSNSKGKNELIVTSMTFGVESIDPQSGKINWSYNPGMKDRTVGSPVTGGGVVFATWGSGNGAKDHVALIPGSETPDGKPKVAWRKLREDGSPDNKGLPYVPTPLYHDGLFYMWGDGGVLQALDAKTGAVVFGPERVGGEFYSNPIAIGNRIFCASRDQGEVVVVEASRQFQLIARNPVGESVNATPAVAGGRLYIRTAGNIICLGRQP
jgi:outer membrane protein assembly factor BamB